MATTSSEGIPEDQSSINRFKEFKKIVHDMVTDLLNTFPELSEGLHPHLAAIVGDTDPDNVHTKEISIYCKKTFPERFFDILYKNETMFEKEGNNLMFLPGIDFKVLWKENITDTTRRTIWKYLQLVLFTVVSTLSDGDSFGDTAKLFETIDENEFKSKLEETINQMKTAFDASGNVAQDVSGIDLHNLPNPQELHDHVTGMMDGKLGKLAREIAEDTAKDMHMDMEDSTSINDVFQKLFKNPTKLMSLVKNVGTKLDEKIKSGDIKESELLAEASNIVQRMKDMPGMGDLQGMLGKMGVPGAGKMNVNAMQSHIQQNMRTAQQKDRMRAKLDARQQERAAADASRRAAGTLESAGTDDGIENLIFSLGEAPTKSAKPQPEGKNNKKKNRKKRGKKNK